MLETSDEYDFTPSGSSNLASLFGTSMAVQNDAKTSLVYSPPKQPKPAKDISKDAATKLKQQSVVLAAKVISLYKLEMGEYSTLGKHGLALIKSPTQDNQEMIIYKEKTNIIARAKINSGFKFINQNDMFSSFFDLSNQNWLIRFETFEDKLSISKHIEILGGIIQNNETNKQEEQHFKGLIDTKDSKREISPNPNKRLSELGFKRGENQDIEKVPVNEDNIDSSENHVKANILNRMAKMGQLLLPSNPLKVDTTDMSDSDTNDAVSIEPSGKPRRFVPYKIKETVTSNYVDSSAEEINNSNVKLQFPSYITEPAVISHGLADETFPDNSVKNIRSTHSSSLYSNKALVVSRNCPSVSPNTVESHELKKHDTEIKLDLMQISTKLDYLIRNLCLPSNTTNVPSTKEENSLRSKLRAVELHRENLTSDLQKVRLKYSQLEENYRSLEAKLYRKIKEHKNSDMDEISLTQYNEKISRLEKELKETRHQLGTLEQYQAQVEDYEEKLEHLNELLESEKLKNKVNEEENLNDECSGDFNDKQHTFNETLKKRMNVLYEEIMMNFSEDTSYTKSQIDIIIAQNIKRITFQIMKDFETSLK